MLQLQLKSIVCKILKVSSLNLSSILALSPLVTSASQQEDVCPGSIKCPILELKYMTPLSTLVISP